MGRKREEGWSIDRQGEKEKYRGGNIKDEREKERESKRAREENDEVAVEREKGKRM